MSEYRRLAGDLLSPDGDDSEARLRRIAIEMRYVEPARLDECVEEQRRLRESGEAAPIGQILIRRGLLTPDRYLQLLDLAQGPSQGPRKRIGRFEILRRVAEGGMGVVYEASDPQLRRTVALKVIREDDADREVIERLHREAAIAAQLRHPNIVGVHEVGMAQDDEGRLVHFIAMDFVEGGTLEDLVRDRRTPRAQLLRMLEEASRAVGYAHAHGVVHRDLKPANILVDRAGRIVLTDFGLARADLFATRLTRPLDFFGTPEYMAPEQVEGKARSVDARTDVYALGVTLYEILLGQAPFHAETPGELYRKILHSEPIHPSRLERTVEHDIEVICLKAMAKEPERRYATAEDFADDLGRFLRGEPIRARPPSFFYRVRKRLARRKAVLAVAGTGLAAVIAAALWVSHAANVREFEQSRDEARRAHAAGEWARAAAECDRAGRIRRDGELDRIAADCRERMARERAETESRLAEAARYRRLTEEKLRPLQRTIHEVRQIFYIPGIDVRERLEPVARELGDLEALARDPANAGFADLWGLLGVGWFVVGDVLRAEEALLEAERRASDDPWTQYYLGRVRLARAVAALLSTGGEAASERRERSRAWCARAAGHFGRIGADWAGSGPLDRHLASAYAALAEGRSDRVAELCREGLERFRNGLGTEEYWCLLGWGKWNAQGLDCYTKAIERCPHHAWAYFLRGTVRQELGDPRAALEDYASALRINPRLSVAHLHRGSLRHASGDFAGAIADYDEAIRVSPRYVEAFVNRGNARGDLGERDGAMADFAEALRIDPTHARAYYNRAWHRARWGDAAGAVADYGEAIRNQPGYVAAWFNRGCLKDVAGDRPGALADFSEVVRLDPRHVGARVNRGCLREASGDLRGALEDFEAALEVEEDHPKALEGRGRLRARLGDTEAGRRDLERAVGLDPLNADLRVALAEVLDARGNSDAAVREYRAAVEMSPRHGRAHHLLGRLLERRGNAGGAMAEYDAAILCNARSAPYRFSRARLRHRLGDCAGAIDDYGAFLQIHPGDAEAYSFRGLCLKAGGFPDAALEDFTQALRIDPTLVAAYNNRGNVRRERGDLPGALADLTAAIRIDPAYHRAYYNRAKVREGLNDPDGALEDYGSALRANPRYAEAYHNRGVLRRSRGDVDGAIEDFEKALDVAPPGWPNRPKTERLLEQARRARGR
ncbi:MAG: tetratricopeptide repeat protein [Planctomycetes bacterium]|nr:tetratricopeptide repeat protein [Planctomycetota bacterium]